MQASGGIDTTTEHHPGSFKLNAGASGAMQTENFNSLGSTPYQLYSPDGIHFVKIETGQTQYAKVTEFDRSLVLAHKITREDKSDNKGVVLHAAS